MSNIKKKKKKKLTYANTVRRSTALKIKEISILEWLTHYGLEEFYHTIFVEKHNLVAFPSKEIYPYEYSHLLTTIKTNVDLLFSFTDSLKFEEAIFLPIHRKLFEMNQAGFITQDQVQDGKIENRFVKAIDILLGQKLEYKAMFSVFGIKPKKTKYNLQLEDNLVFLDHVNYTSKNIFKDEIIAKLKLISFDDLLQCKQTTFNLLLSLPIEEIKKYILYTTNKLVKITNDLKSSFTKKEFNSFIDNNKSLKVFESCNNNYDINYVNKSLKTNFDAKTLLSTHRMDLLEYIFNPDKLIDSKLSEKIYEELFPDNDHIFIKKQFNKIKTIPHTIVNDNFAKETNIRVFFIQGHGAACTIEDYKKRNRVDFNKVFTNIRNKQTQRTFYRSQIHRYNANMFNIISTQPVGRKSLFSVITFINKLLSSKYRNIFLQGLINANKIEHLRLLETMIQIYWNHYCIKTSNNMDYLKLSEHLKNSRLKDFKDSDPIFKYHTTDLTTSNIVNFVKYGYKYQPINTQFHFDTTDVNEGLLGIFELNEENAADFIQLNNKIISKLTKDTKLHLGMKLNEVYEYRGDIPEKSDEIFKYNKELKKTHSNIYTLEEIIEIIYLKGQIKPNEYVIIFDGSCRGIIPKKKTTITHNNRLGNTIDSLPKISKAELSVLRAKSLEDSLDQVKKVKKATGKKSKKYKNSLIINHN